MFWQPGGGGAKGMMRIDALTVAWNIEQGGGGKNNKSQAACIWWANKEEEADLLAWL